MHYIVKKRSLIFRFFYQIVLKSMLHKTKLIKKIKIPYAYKNIYTVLRPLSKCTRDQVPHSFNSPRPGYHHDNHPKSSDFLQQLSDNVQVFQCLRTRKTVSYSINSLRPHCETHQKGAQLGAFKASPLNHWTHKALSVTVQRKF